MTYTERMKRIRQQRAYAARCAIYGLPAILAPYSVATKIPGQRQPFAQARQDIREMTAEYVDAPFRRTNA